MLPLLQRSTPTFVVVQTYASVFGREQTRL